MALLVFYSVRAADDMFQRECAVRTEKNDVDIYVTWIFSVVLQMRRPGTFWPRFSPWVGEGGGAREVCMRTKI